MFLPHPRVKLSIVWSLRDREVACSASDRQGSNFESCVWRIVSSHSSHHPQEVLLAQSSLYVHKGGLNPDSFHFYHVLVHQFYGNFGSKTLCCWKIKYVFRDVKWCFNASWGLTGLSGQTTVDEGTARGGVALTLNPFRIFLWKS